MAKSTFDINAISAERQSGPASYSQCNSVAMKFSKNNKTGKLDWRLKTQLRAHLGALSSNGKYSLLDAHKDMNAKTKSCPKKYLNGIQAYLDANPEVS